MTFTSQYLNNLALRVLGHVHHLWYPLRCLTLHCPAFPSLWPMFGCQQLHTILLLGGATYIVLLEDFEGHRSENRSSHLNASRSRKSWSKTKWWGAQIQNKWKSFEGWAQAIACMHMWGMLCRDRHLSTLYIARMACQSRTRCKKHLLSFWPKKKRCFHL